MEKLLILHIVITFMSGFYLGLLVLFQNKQLN